MDAVAFVAKWRNVELTERSAAQSTGHGDVKRRPAEGAPFTVRHPWAPWPRRLNEMDRFVDAPRLGSPQICHNALSDGVILERLFTLNQARARLARP